MPVMEQPVIDAVQSKNDLGHGVGKVHRVATPPRGEHKSRRTYPAVCGAKVSKAMPETLPHPDDLCAKCWPEEDRKPYGFAAAYEYAVHTPAGLEAGRFPDALAANQYVTTHPAYQPADVQVLGHVPKTNAWVDRDGEVVARET
jgi:hypothetical protein